MFPIVSEPSKISNFIQGNGAFLLLAPHYNYWESQRLRKQASEHVNKTLTL